MKWNVCGIKVERHGLMNTNIVKVVKHFVHYTPEKQVQKIYDEAKTYRDGKWIMFEPTDTLMFQDFINLLGIKRKPNKK